MMVSGGTKSWFNAAELAELRLAGLPTTKRKINELAADKRWSLRTDPADQPLARPRAGRGGGVEYHLSLLPPSAVADLVKRGLVADASKCIGMHSPAAAPQDSLWAWFDRQPDKVKDEAKRRLTAICDVEALEQAGHTSTASVAQVAPRAGVSPATLWNWRGLVAGVPVIDRLPRLAPRRQGGGAEAEIHPDAWAYFKGDYLRPEKPTLASCYARMVQAAAVGGWGDQPHVKTFQRKLEREVDPRVITLRREGQDALRNVLPPQKRSVDALHALQLVNIDGHKWDVFVRFPDGRVARPLMVAIQDVYSRKFLAWRIGETESAVQTRLAFADLFKRWGIPEECLLDNGRAFASKWITGGAANRFRFKVRPEEPLGLLTQFGIKIHWAQPYRGQSKPIERAFRDLCDSVAKHPAFAGAYTGNRPDAKPENYASAAVDLDVFLRVAGAGIDAHNAKVGRRTQTANGRSFDDAFAESYERNPPRWAGEEQLRLALLAADQVSTDRKSGAVSLYGNTYWTPELGRLAGSRVTVRFDPDNLQSEVHVYDATGAFVVTAPVWAAAGFLDAGAAQARARLERDQRRTVKKLEQLEQLLSPAQLAAMLPDDEPEEAEPTAPAVVRMVRGRGNLAAALRAEPDPRPVFLDRLNLADLDAARAQRRAAE